MKNKKTLEDLIALAARLRGDKGCQWDKEQTRESIKPYLVEETYEVLEAIDHKDPEKIKEELGDLLFQIIFHARISEERGEFGIYDVIGGICSKLVRRHPHVFEDAKVKGTKDILRQWEEIKRSEREDKHKNKALHGVPPHLPGLVRAQRLQEKAARAGFNWDDANEILAKIQEEMEELLKALNQGDPAAIQNEIGDLLFAVVNFSRFMGVHAEEALKTTIKRFISRFEYMEEKIISGGRELKNVSLKEMDRYWDEAKEIERG
ncbi:MAG: nucleoside triphosphate pyrophosphohydrolase [Nitrospinae bacterium]|nr:nucleoside triphosphate pyrophosphohydrolase [Nitrospinota bacterium]